MVILIFLGEIFIKLASNFIKEIRKNKNLEHGFDPRIATDALGWI